MLTAKQFKSRMTSNKKPFYIPKTDIELMTEFAKFLSKNNFHWQSEKVGHENYILLRIFWNDRLFINKF